MLLFRLDDVVDDARPVAVTDAVAVAVAEPAPAPIPATVPARIDVGESSWLLERGLHASQECTSQRRMCMLMVSMIK